ARLRRYPSPARTTEEPMNDLLHFLAIHGYAIVFIFVLVDELGLPLPAMPLVIAAGALVRDGALDGVLVTLISVVATVLGNLVWYEAGRRRGASILKLVCRISLEPDSCVRKTRSFYSRYGDKSLVVAHFIPGLSQVSHPMAGLSGMPVLRFI